jgi:bacteriocin-like protein
MEDIMENTIGMRELSINELDEVSGGEPVTIIITAGAWATLMGIGALCAGVVVGLAAGYIIYRIIKSDGSTQTIQVPAGC